MGEHPRGEEGKCPPVVSKVLTRLGGFDLEFMACGCKQNANHQFNVLCRWQLANCGRLANSTTRRVDAMFRG